MPTGRLVYTPNPLAESELAQSSDVRDAMLAAAEVAAQAARDVAPVDTGAYHDSIRAEPTDAGAQVVADIYYGAVIEYGSIDTPAFAPLRRGAGSAGLGIGGV